MPGFWVKREDGNDVHINGDPNMPEETLQALLATLDAAGKQYAEKPSPYQRIGESLVDVAVLNNVLEILINDYTVDKLNRTGELISPDLLEFKQWVSDRYK